MAAPERRQPNCIDTLRHPHFIAKRVVQQDVDRRDRVFPRVGRREKRRQAHAPKIFAYFRMPTALAWPATALAYHEVRQRANLALGPSKDPRRGLPFDRIALCSSEGYRACLEAAFNRAGILAQLSPFLPKARSFRE
jgi:hypothetical protein